MASLSTAKSDADDLKHARCEEMKNRALTECVRVQFMLDSIQKLGCTLVNPAKFITCEKLDKTKAGGFRGKSAESDDPDPHIYISQDVSDKFNVTVALLLFLSVI